YHGSGVFSYGAFWLSYVTIRDGSSDAGTYSYAGTLSLDGTGTSASTFISTGAATGSTGLAQGLGSGNVSSYNSSSYDLSLPAQESLTLVVNETHSEYEAGVFAAGTDWLGPAPLLGPRPLRPRRAPPRAP